MNQFFIRYGLLFIGIILDFILKPFLPSNFGYQSFIIESLFGLIALLLVTRNMPLNKKMVVALFYGLFVELNTFNSHLIPLVSILSIVMLSHITWELIGNLFLEKVIHLFVLISGTLFIKFVFGHLVGVTQASFINYITYEYILTILLNLGSILILLFFETRLFDYQTQRERIRRRREHISMLD